MIDPHVLHGGASSWFRIAANSEDLGFGAASAFFSAGASIRLEPDSTAGSFTFTPTWNCASGDRNFVASHRKM